jgi:DNA polymerase-3 subunit epsilon
LIDAIGTFQTLSTCGSPPLAIASLTGLDDRELRSAPPSSWPSCSSRLPTARHSSRTTRASTSVSSTTSSSGLTAATRADRGHLARAGRGTHAACPLASLAQPFGTAAPRHQLPDAEATAEILLRLIDWRRNVVPRRSRTSSRSHPGRAAHAKRLLAFGAPTSPGVYLFRDAHDRVLYVGRARDLRARLRSYFRSEKLRPAVEAALGVVEEIEWRVLGSELEAALEELRLLRDLRPPANARSTRPDRYVYLAARGENVVEAHGPRLVKSRRRAELAARAGAERAGAAVVRAPGAARSPGWRRSRFEDAARRADRVRAARPWPVSLNACSDSGR